MLTIVVDNLNYVREKRKNREKLYKIIKIQFFNSL